MDIGSIFLILALLVLVGLFVARPFFEHQKNLRSEVASPEEHEFSYLMAERDRILNALQELDFDYGLGKIPQEDYPSQRAALLKRGAEVLRRLDGFQVEAVGEDAEARIETAVAARRADAARSPVLAGVSSRPVNGNGGLIGSADDDIEALLASRRRARKDKSAGFCPKCGGPVLATDRFCSKCGATIA